MVLIINTGSETISGPLKIIINVICSAYTVFINDMGHLATITYLYPRILTAKTGLGGGSRGVLCI